MIATFRDVYLIVDGDNRTENARVIDASGRYQEHRKKYKSINDKVQSIVDLEERKIKAGRFLSSLPRNFAYRG